MTGPIRTTRVIGGRYLVLDELGRGGMGVVWRAEDRVMGRHVAVKELHLPDGLGSAERARFRERLLREARTAGRLNHPGIVTVHDVLTDHGPDGSVRDHIVMELIEAPTLADLVARSGPLDERRAADVARQLLAALAAAHERGVVHRDVKPSNVMLAAGGRVTLTDFGIAQAAEDPRLTTTGSLIGSPAYLAPERLAGHPADPGADLWALGATLYYILAGSSPFDRDTTAAAMAAVLHADIPPLRVSGPLGVVVAGLLQRDPRARLTGAQAVALLAVDPPRGPDRERTIPAYGAAPTQIAPADAPAPPGSGRWRWAAVAAAVGVLLGLLGGGFLGAALTRPAQPPATTLSVGEGGDVSEFAPSVGYCAVGALSAGRAVPSSSDCDDPHDIEVFATIDPFNNSYPISYPGTEQMAAFAAATCAATFATDIVEGPDKDQLAVTALYPTDQRFTTPASGSSYYGSRVISCVLSRADGRQFTGTRLRDLG